MYLDVVGADDLAQHVVGQVGHGLRVGHVYRLSSAHDEGLQLLGAKHGGGAGAGGVVAGVDDAGVGQKVFASRADGGHAEIGALLAGERLGGGTGAQAPVLIGGLDFHVVVIDLQIDRLIGGALDDDSVPAGLLDGGTDHATGVGIDDLMIFRESGKRGDGGAAGQRHAGGREGADGEHDLILGCQRVGSRGNLVVHNLIGDAHAAQIRLVGVGRGYRDGSVGQVDAEDLAGPAIGRAGIQF